MGFHCTSRWKYYQTMKEVSCEWSQHMMILCTASKVRTTLQRLYHWLCNDIKFLGLLQGWKNLDFQLVLWESSSYIFLLRATPYSSKGAFVLSEMAGRTIARPVSLKMKKLFPRVFFLKNHLLHAYYSGFAWYGWRVLIKREIIVAMRMVWPVTSDIWKRPKFMILLKDDSPGLLPIG